MATEDGDRAPLLVGADGNGSAVRSFVFAGQPARFNGQVAFRAVLPSELTPPIVREREFAMHRGPAGTSCTTRFAEASS